MECKRIFKKLSLVLIVVLSMQIFCDGAVVNASTERSTAKICSDIITVNVDKDFPTIKDYVINSSGSVMYGQEDTLNKVRINGDEYKPTVTFSKLSDNEIRYVLNIKEIGVEISIEIKVQDNKVIFNVIDIKETSNVLVKTFEIPNHNIISVRSNQREAYFSGTRMYNAVSGSGDTFISLKDYNKVDNTPNNYLYAILNTDEIAASIWTNAIVDYSTDNENEKIKKQTVKKANYFRTGIWSNSWLIRADKMDEMEPLPSMKIVLTEDLNKDDEVNWQDGAIAFRDIMNNPKGCEEIPNLVVQRIPFNFASQATNPFLKTLDETKRLNLITDGLGQFILLKGYQSEGHDSAHPDYGGHIGIRQGGVKDINTLVNEGKKYNGYFGVHVSATGAHPEAYVFDNELVNLNKRGWDWLDTSYDFDKPTMRREAYTNNRLDRFKQLKEEVPNLDFIYADAWYEQGWNSRRLAKEINSMDWTVTTEFPYTIENDSLWYHWAVDYNYGGKDMKGFNSKIARFIRNHQKDTWIARNKLLGGTEITDYEGWQGHKNFDQAVNVIFNTNLPTKYLQHFPILKWENNYVNLKNNITVSSSNGNRIINKDGKTILNGNKYLLPWNPLSEEKLYHWNAEGGKSTWKLPESFNGMQSVKLYKLTDTGRKYIENLKVTNGSITIKSQPSVPYVIYKEEQVTNQNVNWGEGTYIKDPGFNSGNLDNWETTGGGYCVERNSNGQYELKIKNGNGATISQQVSGLTEGTYSASVYVDVEGNRRAEIGVKDNTNNVKNYTDNSIAYNYIAADSKHSTKMQRMRVLFDITNSSNCATIYLKVEEGKGTVTFDDLRIVRTEKVDKEKNVLFKEDFENVVQGIYPFVKGQAGGVNDPRTHLSELHEPYTQKGWNGKAVDDVINGNWSLKMHKESMGRLIQTIPQTIRFKEGQCYEVTFKYEAEKDGAYDFIIGDENEEVYSKPILSANEPKTFKKAFQGSMTGSSWIGIKCIKGNSSDLIIDDVVIKEIEYLPPEPTEIIPVDLSKVPQKFMTATATNEEVVYGNQASKAIDGDNATLWHTRWDNSDYTLPQSIILDLGKQYNINKISVLPRQDGGNNGKITRYELYTSNDGVNFNKVKSGTWDLSNDLKIIKFNKASVRYVKLNALEGYGNWASLAEMEVYREPVTIVEGTAKEIQTKVTFAPILPKTLPTKLSDNSIVDLPIRWDAVPRENYMKVGAFEVEGDINNSGVKIKITVNVISD